MTEQEREELIQSLLSGYANVLRERLADEPMTLDEIEERVEEIGQAIEGDLERRLVQRRERPQAPEDNQCACPRCGDRARYKDTEERQLITRHGEHTLARRRYYCSSCRHGFVPLDRALGLDRGETTQQVRLWVTELAPRVAVGEGVGLLERMTGLQLSASTFERIAVHVGSALRLSQWQASQRHHAGAPPPVPWRERAACAVDRRGRPVRGVVCLWTALARRTLAGCSIPRFPGGPRSPSCPEGQG